MTGATSVTGTADPNETNEALPRWSVADVHESFQSRSFIDALEQVGADSTRLRALFEEHDIRHCDARPVTAADGQAADAVIRVLNETEQRTDLVGAYVYATVTTDSFDETAQGLLSELEVIESQQRPLFARLADWVSSLGLDALATVSTEVAEHRGPLTFLAARAEHQMTEVEEGLYAEMSTTGSTAWDHLIRHHLAAHRGGRPARRSQDHADGGDPRLGDRCRPGRSPAGPRGRDASLADRRARLRRGIERGQG